MRKIKYRVWDTEEKYFMEHSRVIESRLLDLENNGEGRFVFQQWTGLFDKEGKEIYLGDIVRWTKITYTDCSREEIEDTEVIEGVMDWLDTMFILKTGETGCLLLPYLVEDKSEFEVIGNIYDNTDL